MTTWTVDQIMAEPLCRDYPRERIEALAGRRKQMTTLEIMRCEDVPAKDRLWLAFRPRSMTATQRATAVDRIVTRCITNHALRCGIDAVERWAQRWLSGEDRSMAAACAASYAAADATLVAADAAAEAAGLSNAALVARWAAEAAEAAADAALAAPGAADTAAWVAGWAAEAASNTGVDWTVTGRASEYALQVTDVIAVLGGGK